MANPTNIIYYFNIYWKYIDVSFSNFYIVLVMKHFLHKCDRWIKWVKIDQKMVGEEFFSHSTLTIKAAWEASGCFLHEIPKCTSATFLWAKTTQRRRTCRNDYSCRSPCGWSLPAGRKRHCLLHTFLPCWVHSYVCCPHSIHLLRLLL